MYHLKIYQICHDLIADFATLTSPTKSQLGFIFRTGVVYCIYSSMVQLAPDYLGAVVLVLRACDATPTV